MVAQEIARIAALVALIIVIAAIGVALMVLAGIAVNWLVGVKKGLSDENRRSFARHV